MFKILITDDDGDLRELLEEAVRSWGYIVDVARDGEDALRKVRKEKFDVVISDLMMPVMDGLELLERLKELDHDILVIIVTGYATIDTAVKAIESGAYDYITKPFRLDELMIVLKNACERLKLTVQNRNLLEELRDAYAEIESLNMALERAGAGGGKGGGRGGSEAVDRSKQQGYLKEADRVIGKKPKFGSG
ncbi:MAG: response regulator [Thermodesulfobacteriota bacterium]